MSINILRNRTGLITAGIVGSMTNTVFVLSGIYFFFGSQFKGGINDFLALIISTNSLIEVIATVLITSAVVPALEKIKQLSRAIKADFFMEICVVMKTAFARQPKTIERLGILPSLFFYARFPLYF
ncbi:MAG: hypothetical protein V8R40_00100 [Dysosmobacter sp.]